MRLLRIIINNLHQKPTQWIKIQFLFGISDILNYGIRNVSQVLFSFTVNDPDSVTFFCFATKSAGSNSGFNKIVRYK